MGNQPEALKDIAYFRKLWTAMFTKPRRVAFETPVLVNDYCVDCRFCCAPQQEEEPFPMALLDSQISARTPNDFYLLDEHTACLDRRGCKALGPVGCRLEHRLRPVACGLFPLVVVNSRLYLYRVCPASIFVPEGAMRAMAAEVRDWLDTLSAADIERISITRRPEDLAEKYVDLALPVRGTATP